MLANKTGASHRLARTHKTVTRWQKQPEPIDAGLSIACARRCDVVK